MTSLSRADLHLEFARMCGLSYDLNPRNFEDRWHGFWNLVLGRMCRRLHCNAYGTAQESVWAHNTRHTPPRLADVEVWLDPDDSLTREEEHTGVGVPSQDEAFDPSSRGLQERIPDQESEGLDTGDLEGELNIVDVDTLDGMDATRTFDSRKVKVPVEKSTTQQQASSSSNVQPNVVQMASQELTKSKTGAGPSTTAFAQDWRIVPRAPHVPSGSAKTAVGGTRHRVPDSAINAYYSPDYTPQAMIAARKKRQEWTTNALVPAADVPSNGGSRVQESSAVQARQSRSDVASGNAAQAHSGSEQVPSQSISTNKPSTHPKKRTKQPVFQSVEEVQRELKKLPPTDPEDFDIPLNPISLLHGYKVYETKLVNTESKRLPSRQETEQTTMPWSHSFSVFMDEAQVDNIEQARVLFASPQWEHQNSILLFATSGDFYTHTIATRKPKGDQLVASDIAKPKKERPAFRVQPWSLPTWYGSDASNRREDKLVAWLNETFKHDEMEQQARDLRDKELLNAQERQRTPPAEDNEQNDSMPNPAPPSRPPPPAPPSPRLTRAMKRKLGDNGNEDSRGKDRTKGKGKGKARADPPPEIEQDFDVATSALSPVPEADEDPGANESSDSDEDAPPRKKARTELPPEGPSRSCSPSSAGGDTQSVASASVRPVPTRRSASASAQPAASTSTQPAASTSTRQPSERRRSTRAPHPVKFFNASGKKDAKKNKLKRARTTPH